MADNEKFYSVSDYGNRIDPGERLNLELRMYANRDTEAITPLTALPLEQLQALRVGSAAAEQAIFDNVRQSARAWETQAAQTLLLDMAIEYARVPAIEHTSNQVEQGEYDRHSISNMVYCMNYNISTSTNYDKEKQESIPYAWHVSWSVNTNSPDRRSNSKIAGQYQKRYGSMEEAQKYLNGRIKAYSHLFTEISPPIPPEYAKLFKVNGQLLPGYTVEGAEPAPPVTAADIAAAIARIQTPATPVIEPIGEPTAEINAADTVDHNPDIATEPTSDPAATLGGDFISEPEQETPDTATETSYTPTTPEKIPLTTGDMAISTARQSFDMQEIQNRRFMFNPETGTLILGRQYAGNELVASHAEEHGNANTGEPYDNFIRGWIGTGRGYDNGVIHFAPPIPNADPVMFDKGFTTLEMFVANGANNNTLIRGFPGAWEQALSNIISSVNSVEYSAEHSAENEIRKERDTMNDPISIKISTHEQNVFGSSQVWLRLPATAEQFDNALERIGAQGSKFIISEVEPGIHLSADCVKGASIEQLNHLAAIIEDFDDKQVLKLNAIISIMAEPDNINSIMGYAHNINFHDHHPDITTHAQLGAHCLNESGMIQIPAEWAAAVDVEKLGQLAAEHDKGILIEQGYIVETGIAWEEVPEIPHDYKLLPQIDYDVLPTQQQAAANTAAQTQPNTTAQTQTPAKEPTSPNATDPNKTQAATVTAAPFVLVSDNPRDKMKEITDKLEKGVKGVFESEQYKTVLATFSKFHNYSLRNCLLIAMQKPDATRVGGFNFWRDEMKRPVMKGEKGIKIIAPAPFKTKKSVDKVDGNGKPVFKDGKRVKEEKEITVPAFKVTTVFDVSQTDGEPMPKLATELTGSVDKYKEFFAAVEKVSPVPVDFEKITTGANGYFHLEDKRIAINEGMSELQTLKTLIHEISHARIHDIDKNAPKDVTRPDSRTREVEAESIAYTVCQHYGLDTSDYSFGYIAGWSGGKQLDVLQSSLDTIRKEADSIITEVDKYFAELTKDMEQTAERPQSQNTDHSVGNAATIPEFQKAIKELGGEVKDTLQFFIGEDIKNYGEVRSQTLEMIAVQGYELKDGKLTEAPPVNGTFSIYQLKDGNETRDIRFEPFDSLKQAPDAANYNNVYTAPLKHGDTLDRIHLEFNLDMPKDFTGHSLSVSDVVVMNRDGKETAFYVDSAGFKELPGFVAVKEPQKEAPAQTVDLKVVADYLQKQHHYASGADPNSQAAVATVNIITRRLEQANDRIPDQHPQLKALLANAAQSPDLPTLKERMNTLNNDFIQHYSTAVQNTVDMSGKAEPPAAAPSTPTRQNDPTPATNPPAQGENVAAIEAKVKAGETVNLSDVSDAIKKDKQAAQSSQPTQGRQGKQQPGKAAATNKTGQTSNYSKGKSAAKPQEQPSIKEQLAAGKKQLSGQKSASQKTAAKNKNAGLGD